MSTEERPKLEAFQDAIQWQAKVFTMKESNIDVLNFQCFVETFLPFPANICYHATSTVNLSNLSEVCSKFRDLQIVYPHQQAS